MLLLVLLYVQLPPLVNMLTQLVLLNHTLVPLSLSISLYQAKHHAFLFLLVIRRILMPQFHFVTKVMDAQVVLLTNAQIL